MIQHFFSFYQTVNQKVPGFIAKEGEIMMHLSLYHLVGLEKITWRFLKMLFSFILGFIRFIKQQKLTFITLF
jgi:hypothetical protein